MNSMRAGSAATTTGGAVDGVVPDGVVPDGVVLDGVVLDFSVVGAGGVGWACTAVASTVDKRAIEQAIEETRFIRGSMAHAEAHAESAPESVPQSRHCSATRSRRQLHANLLALVAVPAA